MKRSTKRTTSIIIIALSCLALCLLVCGCSKADSQVSSQDTQSFTQDSVGDTEPVEETTDTTATSTTTAAQPDATATTETTQQTTTTPAATSTGLICIDAGHQSEGDYSEEPIGPGASETKFRVSSGTSGVVTGAGEYEVNLEVAEKLKADLEARGFTVVMVRDSNDVDLSNSERAQIANGKNEYGRACDLEIRLHCDGVDDSSTSGFLTLVPGYNEFTEASGIVPESQAAGDLMHNIIVSELGVNDRGVIERTDLSGFNWCNVTTVLFEMGCMSNPEEDEMLSDPSYQQKMADAITDATVAYFNQKG